LVRADCSVVDHYGVAGLAGADFHTRIEARYQGAVGVVEAGAYANRAGRHIESVVH
jgi:hypothetical protein